MSEEALQEFMEHIDSRFDRLEEKIDRMLHLGAALSDEVMSIRHDLSVMRKTTGKIHVCRFDPSVQVVQGQR